MTRLDRLPPRVQAIIVQAALDWDCSPEDILGPSRIRHIYEARCQAIREARGLSSRPSLASIGRWLNVHHTVVLYALRPTKQTGEEIR